VWIDALYFIIPKIQSFEARKVLAKVPIYFHDAVTLQVKHHKVLKLAALKPEGFWNLTVPSVFKNQLFF